MGGRSSSSNASTTTNADNRLVVDNGGIGVTGSGNSLTLSTTDFGAVQGALDLAKSGQQQDTQRFDALLSAGTSLLSKTFATVQASNDLARSVSQGAVQLASKATPEQDSTKFLMIGVVAAVAVVAVKAFGKRR